MSHTGERTYTNVADRSQRHGKGCRPRGSYICLHIINIFIIITRFSCQEAGKREEAGLHIMLH